MCGDERDQQLLRAPLGIKNVLGRAIRQQTLASHPKDRMRAIVSDLVNKAKQDRLVVWSRIDGRIRVLRSILGRDAKDLTSDQIHPVILICRGRRKIRPGHRDDLTTQCLSIITVRQTLELGNNR